MNRNLPPFPALRAFEAAARHESFTAAGEELYVTHGAISRQIAVFEKFIGMPVFDRIGKRVRLTDAGRVYLVAVRDAFDRISVATDRLRDAGATRVLRINALPTFAMRWLLPRLSQFQRAAPAVELRLSTSNLPLDQLDGFDVAVRRGPERWTNCVSGHFLEETEIPVCSAELLKRMPIRQVSDLRKYVLLHSDTRPDAWRQWFTEAGLPETGSRDTHGKKQSFDHFYLALQAAVDGLGVALGPLQLLSDELASGRLVMPLAGPRIHARGYWWVVSREQAHLPWIRQFCDWLEATANASPDERNVSNTAEHRIT